MDVWKTLIGTFAGALLAFGSTIFVDYLRRRRDERAAGNLATFILSEQMKGFIHARGEIKKVIARNQSAIRGGMPPDWLLLLQPILAAFDKSLRHEWPKLSFLTRKNPNLLGRLAHVSQLYYTLILMLETQVERATEMQKRIESATNRAATGAVAVEELKHALGPHLVGEMQSIYDALRKHIDTDENKYLQAGRELYAGMVGHFWLRRGQIQRLVGVDEIRTPVVQSVLTALSTKRALAFGASVVVMLWMGATIVRIENQRYALAIGMCRDAVLVTDHVCLEHTQTRTGWWWHLYYALFTSGP